MNLFLAVFVAIVCGAACALSGAYVALFLNKNWLRVIRWTYRVILRRPYVKDIINPRIQDDELARIKGANRLVFCGDLILLREMVEDAYVPSTGKYEFDAMFSDVKEYLRDDGKTFPIGIFEGACVECDKERYSTSNYGDGVSVRLNYPTSFAKAVRDAGFKLVSLANNHILDRGVSGLCSTVRNLRSIGLDSVGAYEDRESSRGVKIVSFNGLRIAVLAYTYCKESLGEDFFFAQGQDFLVKPLVPKSSKYFRKCKNAVCADIRNAKQLKPDVIVVIPHMGTEFLHKPDAMQRYWVKFFAEQGVDVILADHPHAVQPIEWRSSGGKNCLVVYCPGNFVNSYTQNDGDASMLVEVYLDCSNGHPIAAACIPLFAYGQNGGGYRAIAIPKAAKNPVLLSGFSKSDLKRMADVNRLVTRSALGVEMPMNTFQERYYSIPERGYVRMPAQPIADKSLLQEGCLGKLISSAKKVCFVGDSVTEGTKNGGYGWYEPIEASYPEKVFSRVARGGAGVSLLSELHREIVAADADLYVIAIGCNDIRYRKPDLCVMTSEDFVKKLSEAIRNISTAVPQAKFVYIAPWQSRYFDPYCPLTEAEKHGLYDSYGAAIQQWCEKNGVVYLDPNPLINVNQPSPKFLVDHIHPTAEGISVYASAALKC